MAERCRLAVLSGSPVPWADERHFPRAIRAATSAEVTSSRSSGARQSCSPTRSGGLPRTSAFRAIGAGCRRFGWRDGGAATSSDFAPPCLAAEDADRQRWDAQIGIQLFPVQTEAISQDSTIRQVFVGSACQTWRTSCFALALEYVDVRRLVIGWPDDEAKAVAVENSRHE